MSIESIKKSLVAFRKTRDFIAFNSLILEDKEKMRDLMKVSLDYTDINSSYVGSWICTHLLVHDKTRFEKVQGQIIEFLENGRDQGSLRSWMNILSQIEINEAHHGKVIDLCCGFIEDSSNKVALQVYSIYTLASLLLIYPELYAEIDALIELHSINKSAAYHASARNFRKRTKNIC